MKECAPGTVLNILLERIYDKNTEDTRCVLFGVSIDSKPGLYYILFIVISPELLLLQICILIFFPDTIWNQAAARRPCYVDGPGHFFLKSLFPYIVP